MSELIEVTQADGIAELRFNRPDALNALNVETAEAFGRHIERLIQDSTLRVLLISGAGRAFMAGGDLKAFWAVPPHERGDLSRRIILPINRALQSLSESSLISIAAVHGAVAGAGMSIALGADFAVAASDTTFNFAYTRIAVSPDCGGSFWLPRLLGWRRAMEIALLSENLGAGKALEWGIVNRVAEPSDLLGAARSLALRLSKGSSRSYGATKRLLHEAAVHSLQEHLTLECESFAALSGEPEFATALQGFFSARTRARETP